MPGAWKPKSGGPVPSTRSPMLPADLAEARPLLSAAKRLRPPRRCLRQRHIGRQPGTPSALPAGNYVIHHVDSYVMYHVCCRGESDRPARPKYATTNVGSLDMTKRARERGKEVPAPSQGPIDTAGNSVQRAR